MNMFNGFQIKILRNTCTCLMQIMYACQFQLHMVNVLCISSNNATVLNILRLWPGLQLAFSVKLCHLDSPDWRK